MPFDWDVQCFKGYRSILVHQEVKVPKIWAANSTDAIVGRVNGEVQVGRSFVVDPFLHKTLASVVDTNPRNTTPALQRIGG
jgi:hypothetical protein